MASMLEQQAKMIELLGAPAPTEAAVEAEAPKPTADEESGGAENPTLFKGAFY